MRSKGARSWTWLRRLALGLLTLLVVLGVSGALFNALAVAHYRRAASPPGKLYAVNGHLMHLYCAGEGEPTLVLESGMGEDFTSWGKIQPVLSNSTRTCSYDRAGLGWSDPQPGHRDSASIADQLHELLRQAGITGPVVLMGHSAGGLHIRAYASRYSNSVAGLIFVDSSSPTQYRDAPYMAVMSQHSAFEYSAMKTLMTLGVFRTMGQCTAVPKGLEAYAGWIKANTCVPAQVTAYQREASDLGSSLSEAARTGPYGDLPILVFSRDTRIPRPPQIPAVITAVQWQQAEAAHDAQQEAIKQLSTHGRRIIATGSAHYIQLERPDLLNREVAAFMREVHAGSKQGDNVSTIYE
ncbi:alpha/beta fold hydrolase [Dyella koreensis]|uniref:Alpha/beta hydrolase n=1 Tax=Dyella koreensis TaxID=311235 RepID=A0ABW8K577_9GAMM